MAKEYLLSSVHVHSKLCDGKNTPEELAVTAWKQGLQTLGFSGHSHTPHDIEYCMTNARTQLYRAQVAKLKERYAGKLDILCGLEWDLLSDDDPAAYDYWIGSTHYVQGPRTGKYYEIDWREADLAACIQEDFDGDGLAVVEAYFANVAAVAAKEPTILGHFDLIKKVNAGNKFFDENDERYTAAADKALRTAAEHHCVLEVNTGAVYRGFRKDFFPSPALLKDWLALGGDVVITADAHDARALTFGFEEAAAQLRELGYQRVLVLGRDGLVPAAL
ncbi:histidinol-phosphatase [bacterium]|nr:histidinol-phosphatase [bacterium]MCI6083367.1 histidinol-phosphatase [bacterium]MCI7743981.1 histidinol-phosphatase [bacterium]